MALEDVRIVEVISVGGVMERIAELVDMNGNSVMIIDEAKSPTIKLIDGNGPREFREVVWLVTDDEFQYSIYQEC